MGNTCATSLSTLEMLDAVEARLEALRNELRAAGLSAREFALLPPATRRKLLTGPAPVGTRSHPFSRIEDL